MTQRLSSREIVNRVLLAFVSMAIVYAVIDQTRFIIYILLGYVCHVLICEVGAKRRGPMRTFRE